MEEHLGLGFCFRLQLSASTSCSVGFIFIVLKVHKCHKRGAAKHSVSETDLDLSLHLLQTPLTPTEVLPPILLFYSWDLTRFIRGLTAHHCQIPLLFAPILPGKHYLQRLGWVVPFIKPCSLNELPCCWNSNGPKRWSAMLQAWKSVQKSISRNQPLVLLTPEFFKASLCGCFSPALPKRRGHAWLVFCLPVAWSLELTALESKRRERPERAGRLAWNRKTCMDVMNIFHAPGIFKCFTRSVWLGPVSHRILRDPSQTSLWSRVPASPPPGCVPCQEGIN